MKKLFPVFRTGTYPQGTFSEADLKEIVDNYDPGFLSAPFSTDHKKDGPAFGYAGQITYKDGTIFANSDDMNPALRKAVREKNYGRVSIELFRHLPDKGRYLKAISFLGVKVPAVKGLEQQIAQAEFEDQECDALEFQLDIEQNELSFQKGSEGDGTGKDVRDEIQKLRDAGMTLQQIGSQVDRSASTLQAIIAGDIANPPESLLSALRKVTPPDDDSDDNDDTATGPSDDFSQMQKRIAALEAEKNALADKFQATDAERQQAEER
ncbi:MAG TPA: helix-turn-helix domain-containing protein, partial [Tichowtungia sp.]|nr:helix-turn-helix domain-containing protein [Tichowtungia sp.]